jgi:hypothetical protein
MREFGQHSHHFFASADGWAILGAQGEEGSQFATETKLHSFGATCLGTTGGTGLVEHRISPRICSKMMIERPDLGKCQGGIDLFRNRRRQGPHNAQIASIR